MLIIAENLERAKHLAQEEGEKDWNGKKCTEVSEKEWADVIVYDCSATEEKVFLFPDAGCC